MQLINQIRVLFKRQYPQSFLIQKPLWGTVAFTIILFLFATVYKPLGMHGARAFSFNFTVLLYTLIISTSVYMMAVIIKKTNCFSKSEVWTVSKELVSIAMILACIGVAAYFAGFIVENRDSRWNLTTFFDSFTRSVLIGIVPVLFPSLLNIRFAFTPEVFQEYQRRVQNSQKETAAELIHIQSKAKKEELSFMPDELIYAESEGN
jgi:predicted Co/Zn/Cd cation transporter (cation efflux family)